MIIAIAVNVYADDNTLASSKDDNSASFFTTVSATYSRLNAKTTVDKKTETLRNSTVVASHLLRMPNLFFSLVESVSVVSNKSKMPALSSSVRVS